MLYNNDLIKKLRYASTVLFLCFAGYTFLAYLDQTMSSSRLLIIAVGMVLSILSIIMMKKPTLFLVSMYCLGLVAIGVGLLFRLRTNLPMDLLLFGIGVGLGAGFASQLKKKNEFA